MALIHSNANLLVFSTPANQPIKADEVDWYNEFYRRIQTSLHAEVRKVMAGTAAAA